MATKPKLTDYERLVKLAGDALPVNAPIAEACRSAFAPSLEWIGQYLTEGHSKEVNEVLDAAYSAAVEAVSLLSLGVARSAAFSIRSHYEFYLMSAYYSTHQVELEAMMNYRRTGILPGEVKKYCRDNLPAFESRWSTLNKVKSRKEEDYYGILSAVAHGNAVGSLPKATKPQEIVVGEQVLKQFVDLISGVSECLSDFSVSAHRSNWLSLPSQVRDRLKLRFGSVSAQKALF